jgi:drug/metabolite transporter (DMT)-like permease
MRYAILVLLNLPIILLALLNIVTQYKLRKVTKQRLHHQIFIWVVILIVLICSFPVYNFLTGKALLDSSELSLFDIFQTTAIVYLIYIINRQRQRIELNEKLTRDLHQELSIKLSKK